MWKAPGLTEINSEIIIQDKTNLQYFEYIRDRVNPAEICVCG